MSYAVRNLGACYDCGMMRCECIDPEAVEPDPELESLAATEPAEGITADEWEDAREAQEVTVMEIQQGVV